MLQLGELKQAMNVNYPTSLTLAAFFVLFAGYASAQQSSPNTQTIKIGDRLFRLSVEGYMAVSNLYGLDMDPSFNDFNPRSMGSKYYRHEFTQFGRVSGGGGLNIEIHAFKNFQSSYFRTGLHYQGSGFDLAVAQAQNAEGRWNLSWDDPCAALKISSLSFPLSLHLGYLVGKAKTTIIGLEIGTAFRKTMSARIEPTDGYTFNIDRPKDIAKEVADWRYGQWIFGASVGGKRWGMFMNYMLPSSSDGPYNVFKKADSESSEVVMLWGLRVNIL